MPGTQGQYDPAAIFERLNSIMDSLALAQYRAAPGSELGLLERFLTSRVKHPLTRVPRRSTCPQLWRKVTRRAGLTKITTPGLCILCRAREAIVCFLPNIAFSTNGGQSAVMHLDTEPSKPDYVSCQVRCLLSQALVAWRLINHDPLFQVCWEVFVTWRGEQFRLKRESRGY